MPGHGTLQVCHPVQKNLTRMRFRPGPWACPGRGMQCDVSSSVMVLGVQVGRRRADNRDSLPGPPSPSPSGCQAALSSESARSTDTRAETWADRHEEERAQIVA
eukprot:293626-Rhodomonas_salina.1